MADVINGLLPLILGSALLPIFFIIVILLLNAPGGTAHAAAFVAGMTTARLVQGFVFSFILVDTDRAPDDGEPQVVVSTLLLVLGILMWISAIRKLRNEPDLDDPPPKWVTAMEGISSVRAYGFGALSVALSAKLWVFFLGAIGVISEADLSRREAVTAFLIFVFGAQILLLLPILASVVAKERSTAALASIGAWLERNNRPIVIAVSMIFGTLFLWNGISGLTG